MCSVRGFTVQRRLRSYTGTLRAVRPLRDQSDCSAALSLLSFKSNAPQEAKLSKKNWLLTFGFMWVSVVFS